MNVLTPFDQRPDAWALGTFSCPDRGMFAGLVTSDGILDLRTAWPAAAAAGHTGGVLALLDAWQDVAPVLADLARDGSLSRLKPDDVTVLPPLRPRQVFQAGANYRSHVVELTIAHRDPADDRPIEEFRAEVERDVDLRAREGSPYIFSGAPSAIAGPYDDLRIPAWGERVDWELELAAVIGATAYQVSVEDALDHVAGYTIANDLTVRERVFRQDIGAVGSDWLTSKNLPGFTPLGPYLVPSSVVGDPADLRLTLRLNGETMQQGSTADLLFDVSQLISYLSRYVRLLPGDLVLTGSPAGNGAHWGRYLRGGDVMDAEITGLGAQRIRCLDAIPGDADGAPREALSTSIPDNGFGGTTR